TLYEVGFNHFWRAGEDLVYIQGHSSPGIYARAFLEGRLTEEQLKGFRQEVDGGGLSSYPHPWLMPDFWQFPTVSMGLGPIMAIYQARFNRYLQNRGIQDTSKQKVWCFVGDGETDEPETLGALTLAAREKLDNLIFVVNCNLQRLDGPVRGNGKIIQELEAAFRGTGWNVIKVIWGSEWDPLLEADKSGLLVRRMGEVVDGEYQRFAVEGGAYTREHFFGKYPELLKLVEHLSDEQIRKLGRGGHDPEKVYNAYKAAVEHRGSPTVILAKTIKGYGLGEAGEGSNPTHQQKTLNEEELREFRTRFNIPISDDEIAETPFYKPGPDTREIQYLAQVRKQLGGPLPARVVECPKLEAPPLEMFREVLEAKYKHEYSSTMEFEKILRKLLQDERLGKYVVPIIPDEARTFGMHPLFNTYGIYASGGQKYEPPDAGTMTAYHEAQDGQILEEGITEAGSMSSFIAAGTAYATHGVPMVPFFIYYSMFGFQRIGDLIWAAADTRARGFLVGGTAGRTTLSGEGLQHEDGHSHVLASTVPTLLCYDPTFGYEIAVIVRDGIRRMYENGEPIFYYLTMYNEEYPMRPMPDGATEGILRGIYKCCPAPEKSKGPRAHILGSGPILREALRAQGILAEKYGVAADVWSVTSYKELRRDALDVERWNLLHPTERPRKNYVQQVLEGESGVFLAASDYMRSLPEMVTRWVPGGLFPLGTDGFGRSENRASLRRFFEVDAECITVAALHRLAQQGEIKPERVAQAIKELGVDPSKVNPMHT
ncbi:MAG TPA: pyruvate dehydrogenase (acetyl-transferring), homodimeric type, partial [Gemmataceae bacterium]|nr:pyruvate dehydrogenase (acetyl-transferring), homodimeric type [Gemmataceae bacterium]